MFSDHMEVMLHDNTQPMVHSFHCSVSLRSDGNFSAIGEVRLWRHDDNVAVIQPLLYLNSSFCLLAADDANALNDTFSDCPHIGFTFRNSDGTFWNCDTRVLRRRWLLFQEAHLGAHFRLDDLQIRPSDLDLDFDRALLAVGCGITFTKAASNCLSGYESNATTTGEPIPTFAISASLMSTSARISAVSANWAMSVAPPPA